MQMQAPEIENRLYNHRLIALLYASLFEDVVWRLRVHGAISQRLTFSSNLFTSEVVVCPEGKS